ncbi:glycosyltransferase family 10 domain-containing protein [Helicobacter muridarum]|nr:glycosyltransferase family 10 [Helicobacter muridarum]STQ87022.1 alpha-1,3-fucosyltransferase [Helicobacter muridarum]
MKKTISMRIVDWWNEENEENFYSEQIIKILAKRYNIVYSSKPDFLIFGPFGKNHLKYDCVRIFITGENIRTDWNIADYGIDFDFIEFGDRHLCLPLFMWCIKDLILSAIKHNRSQEFMDKKKKFCGFLASNPNGAKHREELFHAICKYKKVDSGGKWLNNIGGTVGDRYKDFSSPKAQWLPQYKFNLCPENSSHLGYTTEKIVQAYANGCVPIYWGDWSLCNKQYAKDKFIFNPKSFINAHNFDSIEDLVDEIRRIDNDDYAYFNMLKEPAFIDISLGNKSLINESKENITKWVRDIGELHSKDLDLIYENNNINHDISKLDIYIYIYMQRTLDFFTNIFESSNPKRIQFSQFSMSYLQDKLITIQYEEILRIRDKRIERVKKFIPRPLRKFIFSFF